MPKPSHTKAEIIVAIQKAARKLKRSPKREEFQRLTGISWLKVLRAFGGYRVAIREAGLEPDPAGTRIPTTALLEDWGAVARRLGRHPSVKEYGTLGKYSEAGLITRTGRWCNVRPMFMEFVRSSGLEREWADVIESLETGPVPRPGFTNGWLSRTESMVGGKPGSRSRQMKNKNKPLPQINADVRRSEKGKARQSVGVQFKPEVVLPELRGMRCVTKTMLWALCGANGREQNPTPLKHRSPHQANVGLAGGPDRGTGEAEAGKDLPQMNADPRHAGTGERGSDKRTAEAAEQEIAVPVVLPAELRGRRCVTRSMGWILFADGRPAMLDAAAAEGTIEIEREVPPTYSRALPIHAKIGREWEPEYARSLNGRRDDAALVGTETGEHGSVEIPLKLNLNFARRVIPGRAMSGAPLGFGRRLPHGLVREPVNEAGVVFLFGMVAHLLGFEVEALQGPFPDGEAKMEVEPGRWQHVRFEFEYESRKFQQHRHDAKKCDVIVCWKHNWKGCPEEIQVVELRKILGSP